MIEFKMIVFSQNDRLLIPSRLFKYQNAHMRQKSDSSIIQNTWYSNKNEEPQQISMEICEPIH